MKKSGKSVWRCINSGRKKGASCSAKPVEERELKEYVSSAWAMVGSQRELLLPIWENAISHGNALASLRAAQMKELTGQYSNWKEVENLTRMLILEVQIAPSGKVQILFMDGTCLERDEEWKFVRR